MANFNPGLNPTSDPNYENTVGHIHGERFAEIGPSSREKDLNLFAGVGKAVGTAVEGAYEHIKRDIKDTIYGGVDPLRDAQGVGVAVADVEDQASQAVGGKPANPELMRDSISRIHAAYEQGKISDTNYYAQLEAMTRSIRSRFPGFREEVDAMVHSVTGITPANALRSSILHDLSRTSEAQDALAKEWRSYETSKAKYLPTDYFDRKSSGKPYSQEETRAYVTRQEQLEHGVAVNNATLEAEAKANRLSEDKAETTARDNTAKLDQRIFSQLAPFFKEIDEKMKSGVPLSPEERDAYTARFNQFKIAAERAYGEVFDNPLSPGSSLTLGGLVKDKRGQIIKDHMAVFDTLEKNLFDPKSGLAEMASRRSQTIMDNKQAELLQKYPTLGAVGALSKVAGPAAGEIVNIIRTDRSVERALTMPMVDALTGQNLAIVTNGQTTSQGKTTLNEQTNDWIGTPEGKSPAALKAFVQAKADLLTNPNLPKEQLANAAQFLFGDPENLTYLQRFNEKSQMEVFQRLASPDVTTSMQRLGGEHWRNYSNWVKNSFATVYHSAGVNIADIPNRPYLKVSQDATGHFVVEPTPEGIRMANSAKGKMSIGGNVLYQLERINGDNVKQAVDKINRAIDMVAPVLKADGHSDVGQQVKNLTRFIATTDKKNPTIWQWLLKSIGDKESSSEDKNQTFGDIPVNFSQASGDNSGGLTLEEPTKAIDALKNAFAEGESGGNYNRLVNTPTHPKEAPLTTMKIKDVLAYQQDMLDKGNKSSAAGKYQVVSKTLRSLVKEGVVSDEDLYDEKTQEKVADALLERRGLQQFLNGKISLNQFMRGLGNEWEIIKKSSAAYHKTMFELERLRMAQN